MNNYKTIEINDYEQMLREISISNEINLDDYDLLIYGGGGQDKKYYSELRTNRKYEVLWTGWAGPKWTKFLSLIPGQAGLVRILEQSAFNELYTKLAAYSVSDAIYIRKELTDKIIKQAKNNTWKVNFESITQTDLNSFILTSEIDQSLIENGKEMYLYDYSFSSKINQALKDIIVRKK